MKNRLWMVLFTAAALSLSACGDDANGNGDRTEMDDRTEAMADDATADGEEPQAEGAAAEGATRGSAAGTDQELPEGVTMAMVEQGKTVFEGAGICSSCHGPAGQGIPNLGDNLTDDEWLHSDGDYESIVETIKTGVSAEASTSGVPMPARAGTNISDEQVRAAAAYVWTLSK